MFIRDDWFVHAQAAFAIQQLSGEGIAALNETGNELASHLAIAMMPFSSAGTYGKFFQGEVSFELQAQLTVFELSDLSSREELRSVVLTAIMFMSQQMMRRSTARFPRRCSWTRPGRCFAVGRWPISSKPTPARAASMAPRW